MKPGKTQRRKVIGLCGCPDCRWALTSAGRYGKRFGVVRAESKVEYDLSLEEDIEEIFAPVVELVDT